MKTKLFLSNLSIALSIPFFTASAAIEEKVSDAEAIKILETVNQGEIDLGRLAGKSKNPEVRQFATQMVQQHSISNKDLERLEKKISAKPIDSKISGDFKGQGQTKKAELAGLKGDDFDTQYVASQVEMHDKVLDLLDRQLLPSASADPLKELLTKTRATVATHRDHAVELQLKLAKKDN